MTRRYAEAEQYFDRSIFLAPDQGMTFMSKATMQWLWKGDIDGARATLREIPEGIEINFSAYVEAEILGRNFPAALEKLTVYPTDFVQFPYYVIPKMLYAGLAYEFMGKTELAAAAFDSARSILEALDKELPADWRIQSSLGVAYAGLDLKDDALRAGQLATELIPVEKDALIGSDLQINFAHIYAMAGEYEAALDLIEYLLSIPCRLSVPLLRLDPRWDPLRDHPRFQRILQEHSADGS